MAVPALTGWAPSTFSLLLNELKESRTFIVWPAAVTEKTTPFPFLPPGSLSDRSC